MWLDMINAVLNHNNVSGYRSMQRLDEKAQDASDFNTATETLLFKFKNNIKIDVDELMRFKQMSSNVKGGKEVFENVKKAFISKGLIKGL